MFWQKKAARNAPICRCGNCRHDEASFCFLRRKRAIYICAVPPSTQIARHPRLGERYANVFMANIPDR
jgi:hypothetical protein